MAATVHSEGTDDTTSLPLLTAYESRPGRYVFVETDNTDGWIASNLVVHAPR